MDKNSITIREVICKITLNLSMERMNMLRCGMSGIGTALMIHGYVVKVDDAPSESEFKKFGDTVNVGEYPDETHLLSQQSIRVLSVTTNNEEDF